MKKLLLSLAIMGLVSTMAVAQEKATPQPTKEQKMEWENKVKADLKLTPDQVVKWDALSKEYGDKMDAVWNDASLNDQAKKDKKMALKKEKETKLNEFLSPEQQTKYKEIMSEKKKEMKPGNK